MGSGGGARLSYADSNGARGSDAPWTPTEHRNRRTVWIVPTRPFGGAHLATFPEGLIEPCILAGCPVGGTVLDPFLGAGTAGLVAGRLGSGATASGSNETPGTWRSRGGVSPAKNTP
jgi:site-specific DNA-methyltransferase (adenine-specific)